MTAARSYLVNITPSKSETTSRKSKLTALSNTETSEVGILVKAIIRIRNVIIRIRSIIIRIIDYRNCRFYNSLVKARNYRSNRNGNFCKGT